jgi:hypothetical protein
MQRAARAGSLEGEKLNREPRAPQRAYPAPTLHPAVLYDSLDQVALVGSPQPTYPAPLPRRLRLGERLCPRAVSPSRPTLHLSHGDFDWVRLGDPRLAREPSPPADLPCTGSRAERRGGLPTTPGSQHRHHARTQHAHARTPRTHTHTESSP